MTKLTKGKTIYIAFTIVALTLALFTYFLRQLQAGLVSHYSALEQLDSAKELNHRLNESTLRSRSFMTDNYDELVSIESESQALCARLLAKNGALLYKYDVKVESAAQAHCQLMTQRYEAVEGFKSANSVLRNSINSFPVLLNRAPNAFLNHKAAELFIDLLQHKSLGNEGLPAIQSQITQMKTTLSGSKSKEALQWLRNLEKHVSVVIQSFQRRSTFERKVVSEASSRTVASMRTEYMKSYDQYESRTKYLRAGILLFCGVLALALLTLVYHLQAASTKLSELNNSLEEKVSERTEELSKALGALEAQQKFLAQSAKMSALGEMAGGIAHEINTPLAAISLNAEVLLMQAEQNGVPDMQAGLRQIVKVVERIAKIVMGLRKFSRHGDQTPKQDALLSLVIEDTLVLCQEKIRSKSIRLDIDVDADLMVLCVPEQISQVLLNLLNNSTDAIADLPEKWIRIQARMDDSMLRLSITDSGGGISKKDQEKLMQPFFTTKGVGKGTGIGLSISRGIMQSHDGQLYYDAENPNTTFVMQMPGKLLSQAA